MAAQQGEAGGMIRSFRLRDVLAVRRLQAEGVWLNLYHYLLQRRSPLLMALISPIPWRGTGLASYVWEQGHRVLGFTQMLRRSGRPEADLLFIAPGLGESPDGQEIWQGLLAYCTHSARQQGIRRLFASLARDSAEIKALVREGFAVYSHQDIYCIRRISAARVRADGRFRRQRGEDGWWLRRLYSLYTPAPVQHAEGMNGSEEPTAAAFPWWELSWQRGYVLVEGGEIIGGVQVVSGRRGHWLLLQGDHGNRELVSKLLQQGLHVLSGKPQPVYCAVRDYQGGLRAVLEDHGFEHLASRSQLVKHVVASARVPEPAAVPALALEQSS